MGKNKGGNKSWGGAQLGIVEHSARDARAVTGGGGVIGANDDFDLGQNVGSSGGVGNDEVDGADALAVPEKNWHIGTTAHWQINV